MTRWMLALLVASSGGCATISGPSSLAAGEPAPALSIALLDGSTFELSAARGRVVVVNFWATWCPPCRAEMPALSAFYAKHRGEGLELIGVSVDKRRDRDEVRRIMAGLQYRAGLIGEAAVNGFGEPQVLPTTYVVDRSGRIAAILEPDQGALTEAALEKIARPLLTARN